MGSIKPSSSSQQDGTYAITGIPGPSDVVVKTKNIPYAQNLPVRREVSTLYRTPTSKGETWDPEDKRQWTLLCYALESFKALPVNDKLSYFQVAGIHGYPETDWDSAPSPPKDPPLGKDPGKGANPFGGYCEHNTIAFPTWHRPYMLLFEVSSSAVQRTITDCASNDCGSLCKNRSRSGLTRGRTRPLGSSLQIISVCLTGTGLELNLTTRSFQSLKS